mmetsp:Transcript_53107/g.119716  ORF Transcript_53107/g.119716 Transcript_53107/m.119716 type:complete len:175 (-) Transcript_53107:121-645(-)
MGSMEGGVPWSLLIGVAVLAAVSFHFRLDIAQRVVEVAPGEVEDLRALVWANSLQRFGGTSSNVGTCCYPADWKKLGAIFCDVDAGVVPDAIPMLGHCTAYVRGRAEYPIKMFQRGGYSGNLTQRRDGIYLVKEAIRDAHGKAGDAESCKAIKKCKAKPSDPKCKEVKKALEAC